MNPFTLPVRRPTATAMLFLAVTLLGLVAWRRIPVELFPDLSGDELFVDFFRPASEPEVVERDLLLPLERRISELPLVAETWGEVRGASGSLRVRFERGADLKVRELEMQQIAADVARASPRGTAVNVRSQSTALMSRFVMAIHVRQLHPGTGDAGERNALHDLAEERIAPHLEAVAGVSQVMTGGGAGRQVTVEVDPDRCAAMGVTPDQVIAALRRSTGRLRFLGGLDDEGGRTAVVLDGRPKGVISLAGLRITPELPVRLGHVAEIDDGSGRRELLYRIDGGPAVGMFVFQQENANLVRLGRALRREVERLSEEVRPLGLELGVTFDGSEFIEEEIDRLSHLALGGFVVALLVLYLFLRRARAVAVVAVAVPVSLLLALALLYLGGTSLNLITLFGLAVGIGMLVDNSVVVYEAVARRLERGADADTAAAQGVERTVRAIMAASLTTAVVFLPLVMTDFEDAFVRALVEIVAVAILLPLLGSLLVAVGLVPLLARRLAAPAAMARLEERRRRRRELGGRVPPDRLRLVFTGLVTAALRRPAGWLAGVLGAVLLTVVIALPWVLVRAASQEPAEAEVVRLAVRLGEGRSLEAAAEVFAGLEEAVLGLEGVELVESMVREEDGNLTVYLVPAEERPPETSVARVRAVVREAAQGLTGVEVLRPEEAEGGAAGGGEGDGGFQALLGEGAAEVVISGPESVLLAELSDEIEARLESIPEVAAAWSSARRGQPELRVIPDARAMAAFGLTVDQVLPVLNLAGREGIRLASGLTAKDGRELPMVVKRRENAQARASELGRLRLQTPAGVLPVEALAAVRRMPPPFVIQHHNGRREMSISYRFGPDVPSTGPARVDLERRVAEAVRTIHRPRGTTVEVDTGDSSTSWFRRLLLPAIVLLYLVLAVTFESLTLPLLVLVALPLTILGATWALVAAGLPLGPMALIGTLALLGLTVNPAILLVDRMQQRLLFGGWSAGAAALAAVRERARPVAMTTATTVAGLWPLAFQTGRENEIWPPFATVVMGGLLTSTVLTLLVIPVGFVILARLDRLFGRLGPWVVLGWMALTAAVVTPLFAAGVVSHLGWQIATTVLVGGLLLGVAAFVLWRPELPQPVAADGPPAVEVRHLRKTYGLPGPVGRAWRAPERFAKAVLASGGKAFDARDARERLLPLALLAVGLGVLGFVLQGLGWRLVYLFAAAAVLGRLALEVRRARGHADAAGNVLPGGPEAVMASLLPWLALGVVAVRSWLLPELADERPELHYSVVAILALVVLVVQLGRRTARRLHAGEIAERPAGGRLRRLRTEWRRLSRRVFGLDLPREEVTALHGASFKAERGMVGILGPNGAGKTTLLRQLAGVLEPTAGQIYIGEVPLERLRRYLGRWVGYLPQDTALPAQLTAREYLEYWAILYEVPRAERGERIEGLLKEVGLGERADERIGSYSGGMRQRVAVARTLLRLPPVIIVDEPTVGLDPRERIRFRNLLSRLAEGRVVLFSTHVVDDVAVACERVIVLGRGRLVFDGPPAELVEAARGKVWEVSLGNDELGTVDAAARLADQVPESEGRSRLRLLAEASPHPAARAVEPSLEEGYLMLAGERSG